MLPRNKGYAPRGRCFPLQERAGERCFPTGGEALYFSADQALRNLSQWIKGGLEG